MFLDFYGVSFSFPTNPEEHFELLFIFQLTKILKFLDFKRETVNFFVCNLNTAQQSWVVVYKKALILQFLIFSVTERLACLSQTDLHKVKVSHFVSAMRTSHPLFAE